MRNVKYNILCQRSKFSPVASLLPKMSVATTGLETARNALLDCYEVVQVPHQRRIKLMAVSATAQYKINW